MLRGKKREICRETERH